MRPRQVMILAIFGSDVLGYKCKKVLPLDYYLQRATIFFFWFSLDAPP